MLDGMRFATEGMMQAQNKQEIVANNLANVGNVGYRKEGLVVESFSKVMEEEAGGPAGEVTGNHQIENRGHLMNHSATFMSQGALKESGSPFDMALDDNGKGFFTVQTPSGIQFTRAGTFQLSTSGHLVTSDGSFVMGQKGPIKIQGNDFKVSDKGVITSNGKEIDRMLISRVEDTRALQRAGANNFATREAHSVVATNDFKVKQGYLEQSNFNALTEMVDLMQTARQFEANQKALQAHDQRLQKAVNELGRVR